MLDKVASFSLENSLFNRGDRVLAAISGGADSSAMLCILKNLEKRLMITLSAIHINHNLRGSESKRDEEFCVELCKKLNIKLKTVSVDVKDFCKINGVSTEEGARKLRYDIFFNEDCDKIATAHTLNDSYETALLNLARGTALKGICGIPLTRGKIVRPLLCLTRGEIESYLNSISQEYVTDSTNLTDDYTRNFIRHNIVPKILSINPSAIKCFENTSAALTADEHYLDEIAENEYENAKVSEGLDINKLLQMKSAIRNRVFAKALRDKNVFVSANRINDLELCVLKKRKADISGDVFCYCEGNTLKISEVKSNNWEAFYEVIDIGHIKKFFNKSVIIEKVGDINIKLTKFYFDYDKIKGKLFLRNRMSGDKVKLYGQSYTKKLKKLFNEKISQESRMSTIILSDDEGIVFVEGFGAADRVKIDKNTKYPMRVVIS